MPTVTLDLPFDTKTTNLTFKDFYNKLVEYYEDQLLLEKTKKVMDNDNWDSITLANFRKKYVWDSIKK